MRLGAGVTAGVGEVAVEVVGEVVGAVEAEVAGEVEDVGAVEVAGEVAGSGQGIQQGSCVNDACGGGARGD
jgi:hypothetical protein